MIEFLVGFMVVMCMCWWLMIIGIVFLAGFAFILGQTL